MLLDLEVNVLHVNLTGSTVLHWIARWGDCRVVAVFSARKELLGSLDTEQKDKAGRNAREVLYNRVSRPDRLDGEFERFVCSLEELQAEIGSALEPSIQQDNQNGILRVLHMRSAIVMGLMVASLGGVGLAVLSTLVFSIKR